MSRQPIRSEWATANPDVAIEEVSRTLDTIRSLEHDLLTYVALLREAGWSWERVAGPLGMTRQGAQQAYGRKAKAELDRLNQDALVHPEAQADLDRLARRLSVRQVRQRWEVRTATGELVSKHWVQERAETAHRRAGAGATMELVKLRDAVRQGVTICRTCGERACRCETSFTVSVPMEVSERDRVTLAHGGQLVSGTTEDQDEDEEPF